MYWKPQSSVSQRNKTPVVSSWTAFLASASGSLWLKSRYTTPPNQHILLLVISPSSCDSSPLPHTAASAPIHTMGFLLSPGGLRPEGSTSSHCRTLSPFYLKGFQLSLKFTVNVTFSLFLGSLAWLPCPNTTPITLCPLQDVGTLTLSHNQLLCVL